MKSYQLSAFGLLLILSGCGPKAPAPMSLSPRATEQHIEVLKQPGDPVTVWFWNVPSQSSFDGISVESSTKLEGPYADMSLSIAKTATSVTFPAPDVATFYDPYYWKTVNGKKTRVSSSSNMVQVSIGAPPAPIPPGPNPAPPLGPAPVITAR